MKRGERGIAVDLGKIDVRFIKCRRWRDWFRWVADDFVHRLETVWAHSMVVVVGAQSHVDLGWFRTADFRLRHPVCDTRSVR